jgi:hypothetical protein
MPACAECNQGTGSSDLVAAIISRWDASGSESINRDHARLATQAKRQMPELVREWLTADTPLKQWEARLHLASQGLRLPNGVKFSLIGPKTIRQLNIFSHKVALALYFEHFRRPLSNNGRVQAIWKTKEDFFNGGVPPELLALFGGYGALTQGRWDTAETFEYRHDKSIEDGLFGFFARFWQGLFVLGFAIESTQVLQDNPALDGLWIAPSQLLGNNPHFSKRTH